MPMKPKAPDMPCVSVSTTEKPVYNRDVDCPLPMVVSDREREAIRFLVKERGWYWTQRGELRRHNIWRGE